MTALRKTAEPRMKLGRRGGDEVFTPRPCAGDHRRLVRAALHDTISRHRETLEDLAKV